MIDPRQISIKDFSYHLPEDSIAAYPLPNRDSSKLLIWDGENISEDVFKNLAEHIPANSHVIFNDTKVVEARLLFQKPTGGMIEIFCLEPHKQYKDITSAMLQHDKVLWHCLIGGASKWKHGQVLKKKESYKGKELILKADYKEKTGDSFVIELSWNETSLSFAEVLHIFGVIPLPPYIKRKVQVEDSERYQTVYAHFDGSVAAPTAGLHFTNEVLESLHKKNIDTDFITLHVGAGTFKPVKSELMNDHEMHAEYFTISRSFIEDLLGHPDQKIVAVGTTTLRTLESIYWLGNMIHSQVNIDQGIDQWIPYEMENKLNIKESLKTLIEWMEINKSDQIQSQTRIIIMPGYQFRIVNGLITNFHQPGSTLLLLVAACIGNNWEKVYEYALENDFRFLSYGDGSILWIGQER